MARGRSVAVLAAVLGVCLTLLVAGEAPLALVLAVILAAAVVPLPGHRRWTLLAPGVAAIALLDVVAPLLMAGFVVIGALSAGRATQESVPAVVTNALSALVALTIVVVGSADELVAMGRRGVLGWPEAVQLAVGGCLWFVVDTALWVAQRPQIRRSYRDETARLFSDWRIATALVAASITTAVMWDYSPWWALATAVAPLVVARTLADQAARHQQLVDLTVEALGRLPEAAGVAQQGHAAGVASLATAMGQVDGIAGRELEELHRAALLHDAGLVEATRPDIGVQGFTTVDVAAWGADLLATDAEFVTERAIVAAVADDYRRPGADPTPDVDRRAQIIKVACRFRFMTDTVDAGDALEHMYEAAAYAYDPSVIALVRPGLDLLDARPVGGRS